MFCIFKLQAAVPKRWKRKIENAEVTEKKKFSGKRRKWKIRNDGNGIEKNQNKKQKIKKQNFFKCLFYVFTRYKAHELKNFCVSFYSHGSKIN
jgi:hypothetical protein